MSWLTRPGFALFSLLQCSSIFAFKASDGNDYHSGVVQISAGVAHTCALMADFHISCWGSGGAAIGLMPLPVPEIGSAIKVASGNNFACALLLDHTVSCWGDNSYGQLGDGTHTPRPILPSPVMLGHAVFSDVADITVGDSHVCAIKNNDTEVALSHTIWCWGSNTAGQLGNHTVPHVDFRQPIRVVIEDDEHGDKFLSGAETVSAGNAHTCVLFAGSHTLACWGWNNFRQIGNIEATADIVDSPVAVETYNDKGDLVSFVSEGDLSAGGYHTCVLAGAVESSRNYNIACWGSDDHGQIGNPVGTTAIPATVGYFVYSGSDRYFYDVPDISKLSLGGQTSCAVDSAYPRIECWGDNSFGQLGTGDISHVSSSEIPQDVYMDLDNARVQISVGEQHSCALIVDNVFCWGRDDSGQLGMGFATSGPNYNPVVAHVDPPLFTDNFDGN